MKIPIFHRRKKKLHATTARRSLTMTDADYEEMSEPNMKLSRALLIVLVLHVVAVSGIIAFNSIKTRQGAFPPSPKAQEKNTKAPASPAVNPPPVAETEAAKMHREETKPSHLASQTAVKDERKTEHAKSGIKNAVLDSGKVYTVAKGDNPVTIARKLKVSYDDLLALNHIEDPRKLQIGQKLLIPARPVKTKKPDDE